MILERGQDAVDDVDGKVPDLILRRPEQLWLSVCWEASGALKAVREERKSELMLGTMI